MKLLITINHLINLGGAEKFVLLIIDELIQLNQEVFILSLKKGPSYEKAIKAGAVPFKKQNIDVVILNHNSTFEPIKSISRNIPVFQICHGKYPYLEQPISNLSGYFAVSPEIQDFLLRRAISSFLLWNPASKRSASKIDRDIDFLILSQGEKATKLLDSSLFDKFQCKAASKHTTEISDIESLMTRSKVVVGTGRAIVEGSMNGCATFCFDSRHYDGIKLIGPVTKKNWFELSHSNFSGRGVRSDLLLNQLSKALKETLENWTSLANDIKPLASQQHNPEAITKQLLETITLAPKNRKWYKPSRVIDLRTSDEKNQWSRA